MQDEVRALQGLLGELRRLQADIPHLRERALEAGKALWDYLEAGGRREEAPHLDDEVQNAAYQLLVAVAGVRRTAAALVSLTGYEPLHQLIDAFGEQAQDAEAFRDFFEHFDAYVRGVGKLSDHYMWPDHAEIAMFPTGELIFGLHGRPRQLIVGLTSAADAGQRLTNEALEMAPALRDVLLRRKG